MTQQPIATTRRAEVPKRPRTPGARDRDLTRNVDYGGDVGVVTETYARQTVVDAYPPGSVEPRTVTEKAFANIYAPAGWTLTPSDGEAPGPLTGDDVLAAQARLLDEAEQARIEAELEAETAATQAETERSARERAEQENERLRAELAAYANQADAPAPVTEEPVTSGAKARKS